MLFLEGESLKHQNRGGIVGNRTEETNMFEVVAGHGVPTVFRSATAHGDGLGEEWLHEEFSETDVGEHGGLTLNGFGVFRVALGSEVADGPLVLVGQETGNDEEISGIFPE